MYKQRVKHLLYEHQDGLARLKATGEAALKQQARGPDAQERGGQRRRTVHHVVCLGPGCYCDGRTFPLLKGCQTARRATACCAQADAFARQEAQLAEDKRRLKQHVREQELSAEELIKQFRQARLRRTGSASSSAEAA